MVYAYLIGCLVLSYLLGSLNGSIIFSKIFKNADIRDSGSKNAGMTNTLRVFGKKAAVFVFLFDLLKAIGSVLLARFFADLLFVKNSFGGNVEDIVSLSLYGQYLASFGAILGHNFPVYFRFRGGKGILASWGVIMILDWRIALMLIVVFGVLVAVTRYVSLASIASSILYPLFVIALNVGHLNNTTTWYYIGLSVVMGALAVWRHRANIIRLTTGTESKLGAKKEERE